MAVPKRKHSNSRTGKRRSHDRLKPRQLTSCSQCSTAIPTHVICPKCGYYMGREVIKMEDATL
jgi:large subunit ribosomal protein L32